MVSQLGAEFIADSSDAAREAWLTAREAADRVTRETADQITGEAADRKCFLNKHAFYEEGE